MKMVPYCPFLHLFFFFCICYSLQNLYLGREIKDLCVCQSTASQCFDMYLFERVISVASGVTFSLQISGASGLHCTVRAQVFVQLHRARLMLHRSWQSTLIAYLFLILKDLM